jgi:hypothetical protein
VKEVLDRSARLARQGVRPPAQCVRPERVGAVVARLVASVRRELLTFDDPSGCVVQGVSERRLVQVAECAESAYRRAPEVRQLSTRKGATYDERPGVIRFAGSTRLSDRIPFRLGVMDRTVAVIPLDLEVYRNGMLIIRDPVVVRALVRAHRSWWSVGEGAAAQAPGGPPEYLAGVLECLLSGVTDDVAAARLGLSGRTYTRRVADLLGMLGAVNRFQAGARAAERGWV